MNLAVFPAVLGLSAGLLVLPLPARSQSAAGAPASPDLSLTAASASPLTTMLQGNAFAAQSGRLQQFSVILKAGMAALGDNLFMSRGMVGRYYATRLSECETTLAEIGANDPGASNQLAGLERDLELMESELIVESVKALPVSGLARRDAYLAWQGLPANGRPAFSDRQAAEYRTRVKALADDWRKRASALKQKPDSLDLLIERLGLEPAAAFQNGVLDRLLVQRYTFYQAIAEKLLTGAVHPAGK